MNNRFQVVFDLHTSKEYENILKSKYKKSLSVMYDIIKKHFIKNDFSWIEGSTYFSNNEISTRKLNNIVDSLYEDNLWLSFFTRDLKRTIIKDLSYNYNNVINEYKDKLKKQEEKDFLRFKATQEEFKSEKTPKLKQ